MNTLRLNQNSITLKIKDTNLMILSRINDNILRLFALYNNLNIPNQISLYGLISSNIPGKQSLVLNIVETSRFLEGTPSHRLDLCSYFGLVNDLLLLEVPKTKL